MVSRAEKALTSSKHDELHSIVEENRDIFRTKIGADPPANAPPFQIELKENARPVKVRQRT